MEIMKKVFNKKNDEEFTEFISDEAKFLDFVQKYREKNIPKRYNQIQLMDWFLDEDVDHLVSISNRADGKSFNYNGIALDIAIEYNFGFTFIVRHHTVQEAGQRIFQKIIDMNDKYNPRDFMFMRGNFYITLIYKDRTIGVITDLNKATDLKYQSNFLEDFPFMIYDEFLALEGDYLPDEWDKLKTIYSSINRKEEIPLFNHPKILYLGNAVNFSSPVLSELSLFNILEKHPMNTQKKYENIVLEFNRNDNANEIRNLRAFKEDNDAMSMGEFEINSHNIANKNDRNRINKNPDYVYIKLRDNYLKIIYNKDTYSCILSIVANTKQYDFNMLLKDNKETSIFLKESFYDIDHEEKYNKNIFLFDNMYSKDVIVDGYSDLTSLKINKIIKTHIGKNKLDNFEHREKVYHENYIENTKKSLYEQFLNG